MQICQDLELRYKPRYVRVLDERQEETDLHSLVDDSILYLHYCQVTTRHVDAVAEEIVFMWTEMQSECETKGSMSSNAKNGTPGSSMMKAGPLNSYSIEHQGIPFGVSAFVGCPWHCQTVMHFISSTCAFECLQLLCTVFKVATDMTEFSHPDRLDSPSAFVNVVGRLKALSILNSSHFGKWLDQNASQKDQCRLSAFRLKRIIICLYERFRFSCNPF